MNSNNINTKLKDSFNDELTLREFFIVMWRGKWIIVLMTLSAAILSVYIALSKPNIYTSTVLLSPANSSSGSLASNVSSRYGGLASLAGISLDGGQVNDVGLGIEIVKTRSFIVDFIKRRDILVPLFAMKSWENESNKIILNEDVYNKKLNIWLGDLPSYQDAFDKFTQMMSISINKKTGIVSLSITSQSPVLAQQWASWLVEDLNNVMKNRVVTEAKNSILFLQREIESTSLTELRLMFSRMMQEQTKIVMLGNVRPEYLFTIIDPAIIPERKVGPIRSQIAIIGTFMGGVFSVLLLFLRRYGPEIVREKNIEKR